MFRSTVFALIAVVLALILGSPGWARPAREATIHDDLARQLRRAVEVPPSKAERQFAALAALRQLRDVRLQPLFADLAARPRADLRAEGILALAELAADGNVNLAMVGEIKNQAEQSLVILEALAAGRLSAEQASDVLSWPKLDPRLEIALRARAVSGKPSADARKATDVERVRVLAGSEIALVRVLAETLLANAGDAEAGTRVSSMLSNLSAEQRAELMGPTLETISRERLLGAAPIAQAFVPLCSTDGQRAAAAATLMRVAPGAGSSEWLKQWANAKEPAHRVRLALAASESADQAEPAVFEALIASNEEPPAGIGRAIASLRAKDPSGVAPAFIELIAQGHAQSMSWALERASALPLDSARRVYLGTIERVIRSRDGRGPVVRAVFDAGWRLAERDAAALGPALVKACADKDAPLAEALLAALIRGGTAPAWDEKSPPAFPGITAQSMALLYRARLAGLTAPGPADPDSNGTRRGPIASGGGFDPASADAEMLRQVALGRGNLPEAYRVVASWLALCQDGKEREALTRILAPDGDGAPR